MCCEGKKLAECLGVKDHKVYWDEWVKNDSGRLRLETRSCCEGELLEKIILCFKTTSESSGFSQTPLTLISLTLKLLYCSVILQWPTAVNIKKRFKVLCGDVKA